jgi:hypothetical protein
MNLPLFRFPSFLCWFSDAHDFAFVGHRNPNMGEPKESRLKTVWICGFGVNEAGVLCVRRSPSRVNVPNKSIV